MSLSIHRVLIVGRPNVGKSSLFNRLIRKRKALVVNQPGVTRDILKQKTSWWGNDFEVWDSGGLWAGESVFGSAIDKKVKQAVCLADLILFVMSARSGLLEEDKKTFHLVRKSGKPFLVLINKVDEIGKKEMLLSDFYSLGCSLLACAFEKDRGISEVVEWIISQSSLKKSSKKENSLQEKPVHLLLMGKTNVGKSTLCNALLKRDRSLISPVAGTTQDVVSDQFRYGERLWVVSDTAGKTKFAKDKVKSLAEFKTGQSLKTADVVLLLLDYSVGPGRQETRLIHLCEKEHKALIVVVNKWDLAEKDKATPGVSSSFGQEKEEYRKNVQNKFRLHPDLPVVFVSALNSSGLSALMKKVEEIYQKLHFRISTSELNGFFMKVIRSAPLPVYGTQNVKLYYLTQTKQVPPSFIAFANYPEGVRDSYRRFLVRQIQKKWDLKGIPIRISIVPK